MTGQAILHTMHEFLCRCRGFEHVTSTSWPGARWPIRLTLGLKRCTRPDQKCGRCVSWVHSLEIRGNTNARWTLTRNSTLQSNSPSKVRVCIPYDTVLTVEYMSNVCDAWTEMGNNSILINYGNKRRESSRDDRTLIFFTLPRGRKFC